MVDSSSGSDDTLPVRTDRTNEAAVASSAIALTNLQPVQEGELVVSQSMILLDSLLLSAPLLLLPVGRPAHACSRILYETGSGTYIVGRGMDWNDPTAKTSLWVFPEGMKRDGGVGRSSVQWTSKYGSLITSFYDSATVDGMNEAALVGNVLYLAESDYGDPDKSGKPTLSIGAWLQYILDRHATVEEAVEAMQDPPFAIVAPMLPNGRAASAHLSISDPSGDSAIFEYLGGELVIHHGPECRVMTNSPIYEQQIALNTYWDLVGGNNMLPGTISAADRFVRTVSDHDAKPYYFESAIMPSVFWVDLEKVDLKPGASVKKIDIDGLEVLAGEVSAEFEPAKPFRWLASQ